MPPNTVFCAPDKIFLSTHNVLLGVLRDKAYWSLNTAPSALGNTWQSVLSVPVGVLDNRLDWRLPIPLCGLSGTPSGRQTRLLYFKWHTDILPH